MNSEASGWNKTPKDYHMSQPFPVFFQTWEWASAFHERQEGSLVLYEIPAEIGESAVDPKSAVQTHWS